MFGCLNLNKVDFPFSIKISLSNNVSPEPRTPILLSIRVLCYLLSWNSIFVFPHQPQVPLFCQHAFNLIQAFRQLKSCLETSPSSRRPLHRLTSTNRLVDYTSGGKNLEPVGAIIPLLHSPPLGLIPRQC